MRRLRLLLALLAVPALPAAAQTPATKAPLSAYDRTWRNFTEWYVDDTNPVVQRVLLSGRFHYDFAAIDSDVRNHDEWNAR